MEQREGQYSLSHHCPWRVLNIGKMSKKIFIKTIPRETATKVSEIRNNESKGQRLNKTKLNSNCRDGYMALYNPKIGGLATGLTDMVDNPYKDSKSLPTGFEDIKGKEQILRQTLMEMKHQRPRDYYNNRAWTKADSAKEENLTFFQKFRYKLNDGGTMLDMAIPEDEITYYMALATQKVANSEKEWKLHKWPRATHYIAIENESESIKFQKKQYINLAVANLHSEEMDTLTRAKFVKILKLGKGNMTDEQSYNLLSEYIQSSTVGANSNVDKFTKLYKKLSAPEGREEIEAQLLLIELLNNWIVNEKQGTYTWNAKDMVLGQREEEALEFLLNPNKQPERDELEKQLKAKRGY